MHASMYIHTSSSSSSSSSSSWSSSCRAAITVLSDPLSPPVSLVHRSREVYKAISFIGTEQLYIGSCWSSYLCSSIWRDPQEYVTHEFIHTSLAVSRMSGSSKIVFVMGGRWPYRYCFGDVASMTCSILLVAFLCSCCQAFSPYV